MGEPWIGIRSRAMAHGGWFGAASTEIARASLSSLRAYLRTTGAVGERLTAAAPALITMLPLVFFADASNRFRGAFALLALRWWLDVCRRASTGRTP